MFGDEGLIKEEDGLIKEEAIDYEEIPSTSNDQIDSIVDELDGLVQIMTDDEPEKLKEVIRSFDHKCRQIQEHDESRDSLSRATIYALSESLTTSMDWVAEMDIGSESEHEDEYAPNTSDEEWMESTSRYNTRSRGKPKSKTRQMEKSETRTSQSSYKIFKCNVCGKVYRRNWDLMIHKRMHADDVADRMPFHCDVCGKRFTALGTLRDHKNSHLAPDDPQKQTHDCEICGKSYAAKSGLRHHARVHKEDEESRRPYKCSQCDLRFAIKWNLKNHELTHIRNEESRRPHKCDECDKRFTHAYQLTRHKTRHMDPNDPEYVKLRKYQCEECGKRFGDQYYFSKHLLKHTEMGNERPFECDLCEKSFKAQSSLVAHKLHHGIVDPALMKFKCDNCQRVFQSKATLATHKKKFAGVDCRNIPVNKRSRTNKNLNGVLVKEEANAHGEPSGGIKLEEDLEECGKFNELYDEQMKETSKLFASKESDDVKTEEPDDF